MRDSEELLARQCDRVSIIAAASLAPRVRALLPFFAFIALAGMLTACAVVPGQRMVTPPTIDQTGGEYSSETRQTVPVPITDINLSLIRQMNAQTRQQKLPAQIESLFGTPGPYRIGPGDVLQITVWDHPELAAALGQPNPTTLSSDAVPGFLVDQAGNVQFPYAGNVHVQGENVDQIRAQIVRRLSRVFKNPEVTVRVASYRSSQVYIDGEVHTTGTLQINDIPMTLSSAIGRAGGFTANADQSRVTLVRNGTSYSISFSQLVETGHGPSDIMLKPGDLVKVAPRDENGVYVMGEVNKPATVMPFRNGKLTLAEAISQAGSFNPSTSNAKQLFVIRDSTGGNPQIYHLDATSPVSMVLANQFELQPKDVVFADNGALVKFNRVMQLLLPVINAGLTAAIVTK